MRQRWIGAGLSVLIACTLAWADGLTVPPPSWVYAITSLGSGVATALGINVGSAGGPVTNGGALGTPSSGTATNITGCSISSCVSGLAANVATFLGTPSSANLAAAVTDESGTAGLLPFVSRGSWTLTDISGGSLTFTSVVAEYTRIGNMVFASAAFVFPSTADTNLVGISGLPFTVPNRTGVGTCSFGYSNASTAIRVGIILNTTNFGIYTAAGAGVTNVAMSTSSNSVICIYTAT